MSQAQVQPESKGGKRSIQSFDADGDGKIDANEQVALNQHMDKREQALSFFKTGMIIALVAFFVHLAASTAITYAVVEESKETKSASANNQSVLTTPGGTALVATAEATEDVQLYLAPVLPDDVLHRIKSMTITARGVTVGGVSVGGAANSSSKVEFGLRVTGHAKVSDTEIVFSTGDGSNLRVKGGQALFEYKGTAFDQKTYSACAQNAKCSSLDVSGSFDVAVYTAKADAALAAAGYSARRARRGGGPMVVVSCPPGYFYSASSEECGGICEGCLPGTYNADDDDSTSCPVCPENTYQPDSEASACISCPSITDESGEVYQLTICAPSVEGCTRFDHLSENNCVNTFDAAL